MARVLRYASVPPPLGARIDWGHQLASGLFLVSRSAGSVMCDINNVVQTVAGGHAYGWCGTNTVGPRYVYDGRPTASEYTIFLHSAAVNTGDTNKYICMLSPSYSSYQTAIIYGYASRTYESYGGANNLCARLQIGVLTSGDTSMHSVGFTRSSSRYTAGYFDGRLTATGTGKNDFPDGFKQYWIARSNLTNQYNGAIQELYVYTRVLTPTEVAWLHVEPFAMFLLEKPVYYSIPSTVYRAYPRSRIIGTGVYCL